MFIKILLVLVSPVFLLFLSFILHLLYFIIFKGERFSGSALPAKKVSFFRKVFFKFPYQFWIDRINATPGEFQEYGLHLFCGEQGSGKTTAVVELLQRMSAKYPQLKIRTNFHYSAENSPLGDWKDLVKNQNGIYGQIEVIDEIQTWFNSNQSRNFPVEMLTEISQQRKQRKMLVGTAQVFSRVAKPIREQTTFVYLPMTLLGCLTIVRVSKPQFYDDEKIRFKKFIKTYFFVHDDKIRNAFDTYKKIEGMSESGFSVRHEFYPGGEKL